MTEKEIGMEKLMKYVEEMQKEGINICRPRFQEYYLLEMMLVSKHYGLIKWLVENDKIDLWSNTFTEKEERYFGEQPDFTFQSVKYTHLLMLLSISSSPIDDLLLYLK